MTVSLKVTSPTAPAGPPVSGVKGAAVRAGLRWVTMTYGDDCAQKICEEVSPPLRAKLIAGLSSFGVLSTEWYDVNLIGELLDVISNVTRTTQLVDHLDRMADAVAADNVQGVYRSLFRLIATRPLLIAHANRVWSNYFSSGSLLVRSPREGELILTSSGAKAHHSSLCTMTSRVLEKILLRVGYKGATLVRAQCRGSGDRDCVFEVDYVC